MSLAGDPEVARAREVLLDALEALGGQLDAVILVGAQAIYLHTGPLIQLAIAERTFDGDVAVDPRVLEREPLLEKIMEDAGFKLDPTAPQPGSWIKDGIAVDLMVPEALAGEGGRRGVRFPPHSKHAAR